MTDTKSDYAALLLRLGLGVMFLAHGLVLKLLTFDGQLFDIVTTPTTSHGQSGVDLMEDLQDNFDNATVLH